MKFYQTGFSCLLLCITPQLGYAESADPSRSFWQDTLVDFSLLGGLTLSNLSAVPDNIATTQGTGHSIGIGWGYKLLVAADIKRTIGVESGLSYSQKRLGLSGLRNSSNLSVGVVNIPLMARWTPHPIISLHAGFYLGLSSNATLNIDGGNSNPVDSSTDSGLVFGVSLNQSLYPHLSLTGAGFYELGMKDVSTDSSGAVLRSFGVYVGLKYKPVL